MLNLDNGPGMRIVLYGPGSPHVGQAPGVAIEILLDKGSYVLAT